MSSHCKLCAGLLLAVVSFCSIRGIAAAPAPAPAPATTTAPAGPGETRLVVMIVVDQLRADLPGRYGKYFGEDGFKRLMKRGACFPNAYFTYGANCTAVGHATLGSGRLPRQHGIINNEWFFDPEGTKEQQSAFDKQAKVVGLAQGESAEAYSPRFLIGPSLGDELKLADKRSRVFSVSLKPRAAVMIAGQNPDGVFWWDVNTGKFVTSTWYSDNLPAYVAEFNQARGTDKYVGQTWDKVLPAEAYAACLPVDPSWITYDYHLGPAFPHKIVKTDAKIGGKPYDSILASPFGNDIVLDVAKRILGGEKLGRGPAPDMLCVSFSANDLAGHIFGPNSVEMLDMTVRTDRQIAELLAAIDQQVGLGHCAIALAGDHGVKEIPQIAAQSGLGGGLIDMNQLVADLNKRLPEEFGQLADNKPYVLGILPPWLWFSPAARELDADKQVQVLQATTDYLAAVPGVAEVYTAADLEGPSPIAQDSTWWMAWRSYCPGRSGDLYIHLEAAWYQANQGTTGHGTAHSDDRHVPVILSAPGVRPGRYLNAIDPMDVAPTLAAILGIEPPIDASGRVLSEAFGGGKD